MKELADWEKEQPLTDSMALERQAAFACIQDIRRQAQSLEGLLPAFAVRSEFLRLHPRDAAMVQLGSDLIRAWELRGGTYEDLAKRLGWSPAQASQKVAA